MAGKVVPPLEGGRPRKQLKEPDAVEWAKNTTIFLLSLSALVLTSQIDAFSELSFSLLPEETTQTQGSSLQALEQSWGILPQSMVGVFATETGVSQLGVEYNSQQMEDLLAHSSQTLKESLGNLGKPTEITLAQFLTAVETPPSLYVQWQGEIPLTLMESWLWGQEQAPKEGSASRILLSNWQNGTALLYQEGNRFYVCPTPAVEEARLVSVVESFWGEAYDFAFQQEALAELSPLTLIPESLPRPWVYTASTPFLEEIGYQTLLERLNFPANTQSQYQTDDEIVLLMGRESLRLSHSGTILYQSEGSVRYRLPVVGEDITLYQQVEGTRQFLLDLLQDLEQPPQISLLSVEETQGETVLRFCGSLEGITLSYGKELALGEFVLEGDEILSFRLQYRDYSPREEQTAILPHKQAVAILESLGKSQGELLLVLQDNGGDSVVGGWVEYS